MYDTSWQSDQMFRLTMAIPSCHCGTGPEAWVDKNLHTMADPGVLSYLLSSTMKLLRAGGPKQCLVLGEVIVLDSSDDTKHDRLAHAQGGTWKEALVPGEKKAFLQ